MVNADLKFKKSLLECVHPGMNWRAGTVVPLEARTELPDHADQYREFIAQSVLCFVQRERPPSTLPAGAAVCGGGVGCAHGGLSPCSGLEG